MKRFLAALIFCVSLLIAGTFLIATSTTAKEDVVVQLLALPAPPPGSARSKRLRSWERRIDRRNPPKDDAPIAEILEYWEAQSGGYRDLGYNPKPSPRVLERIRAEIEKKPESVARFLNIFRDSSDGIDLVKRIYDNWPPDAKGGRESRSTLKSWLTMNSAHFSHELSKIANKAGERGEYVSSHNELLALAQHDWDAVRPTVDRLYSDSTQPVSRVLGMWALYKHALAEDSLGEIDRYRNELIAVVEDKKATPGMRDLAFDALVKEKDWSGRDEWYFSLLDDETLGELRVNGSLYTGLTTIVMYSHPDKYADKMIELVKSTNPVVRNAAARNLGVILDGARPDVARALLPWLDDPKWAKDTGGVRTNLVRILRTTKMPDSVPGLITALEEKETFYVGVGSNSNIVSNSAYRAMTTANATVANAMATVANSVSRASNSAMNANAAGTGRMQAMTRYPLRSDAVHALATQADMRAAAPLRRILRDVEPYERSGVVKAILMCKGFTVAEQADAIESLAREAKAAKEEAETYAAEHGGVANAVNAVADSYQPAIRPVRPEMTADELKQMLGLQLLQVPEPGDLFIREIIARITGFERTEPELAQVLRMTVLNWKGPAVNALLLKDLKDNKTSPEAIVKLLGQRKSLQEKQPGDLFDIRTGSPTAAGVSACLLESERDYAAILSGPDAEAKAAMLACARLIRAKLPVRAVAGYLSSADKRLALAAERYLESEDSPEARRIIHSIHPNEIKILGATTAFWPEGKSETGSGAWALFMLDGDDTVPAAELDIPHFNYILQNRVTKFDDREKQIRDELKSEANLKAVYSYEDNYVHIYKDKVVFSWDEDESRYRERIVSKDEFERLTGYMADHNVDELGPFLACPNECGSKQLLMVGKQGGRRVFVNSDNDIEFFAGLESIFEEMRSEPAKLRYRLEKEIPGLEILFADDSMSVETIWKNGPDFRVLTADLEKRKIIDEEIAQTVAERAAEEDGDESVEDGDETEDESPASMWELEKKRRFENYAWHRFADGTLAGPAVEPDGIDLLHDADSDPEGSRSWPWKAKAAGLEVKVDDEGLMKVAGGKTTRLRSGPYESPVITANGKWVFATKYADRGPSLWRINLLTNREYLIESKDRVVNRAVVFVPSVNKILATPNYYEGPDGFSDEYMAVQRQYWVDPDTGAVQPAAGELRPLAQQSFRRLQPGPGAFEFWAAIYDPAARKTNVGIYNSRSFSFKALLSVPKISFNSMDMWADSAEGRIYFVYKGHLLALPLPPSKAK